MRLNQIEIAGFKSFPERSELIFDGSVTAIVGPNGCGKSNVIDAISWVLGEQSARSLRGERMEDVIFSGSDARRPTATAEVRLQLSQVTAVLAGLRDHSPVGRGNGDRHRNGGDNGNGNGNGGSSVAVVEPALMALADTVDSVAADSDGAEDVAPTIARNVEVARRLYRSGESEYLIDGEVCRLRDVQDLLMDSGVGIKAYAVIEQGKIGQILGARPMERRQLLEEAAGVTKYKTRRRSAELKLEAAQQNLTRVDDIVFEVEKQRGALKRQAAKARRYRRLREELRRWEKIQFGRKSVALSRVIEDVVRRLDDARQREQGAAGQLSALETAHEHLQLELVEADGGATVARDAAHAHELEMGRRQQQIEFDRSQVSSLSEAVIAGESERIRLEERLAPLKAELAEQEMAVEQCRAEQSAAATRLQQAEASHAEAQRAIEGLEEDVEASRSEVFAAVNAATALRHVVENVASAWRRLSDERAKLETELADLTSESDRGTTERRSVEGALEQVSTSLDAVRKRRVDSEAELASARAALEARADDVRLGEHSLASVEARLRSIEELVANREGYSDAARLVLSQVHGEVDHLGSVADHLDVDRRYERAVEASLDDLVQYVIVRSSDDAKAGIVLARSRNAGRCGFVVVEAQPVATQATVPHPALTPLGTLVRVDGAAAPTVQSLLQRRWFAPSFEAAALAAASTTDPIVTPDGTVFRGPSVVRGGGKTQVRGILATKGETRELQSRMATAAADLNRVRTEVARYASIAGRAEAELKTLQAEEHRAEKELLELGLQSTRLDEELARLQQKGELVRTERRTIDEELELLDARQAEASQAILRLENEQRTADEHFMSSQRELLEARESVETLGRCVTEAKAEHAALVERAGAWSADVGRVADALRDLEDRLKAQTADIERTAHQRDTLTAGVEASKEQLERDIARFESFRHAVRTCDDRVADVRGRTDELVGRLRLSREALDSVRSNVGELTVRRATVEADLGSLDATCRDVLQLTLSEVCDEVVQLDRDGSIAPDPTLVATASADLDASEEVFDESGPVEATGETEAGARAQAESADGESAERPPSPEEIIATLREKIERLGPVNMMAVDQFDELEQRFDFLTTQRKDLLDSIQATGEAIKRIDVTTCERFKEAYTAVNVYFQEIFGTLFGGGRAGLVLIDETDILESGIDIIAQPPGKRLQNIQLLSGGEKALTAMALMFAIFKFKPSPFCLLDEIDASLDDANIGQFVSMLRGMQDRTQFVLVTHNRKTMEIADRLYGVTMEEPGVSKLISVKLN